jgi:hypothetical protein
MSTTLTISDELAAALEARRERAGMPTLDAAAEALLADAIALEAGDADGLGLSDEGLRALIAEGETSGPAEPWDAEAAREAVRSRFASRRGS